MELHGLDPMPILANDSDKVAQPYKTYCKHTMSMCKLNPRRYRLLKILYEHEKCSRHDLDGLIGAENSPQIVSEMRNNYGWDILMVKKKMLDRDGKASWRGVYSLSEKDRERAQSIFSTVHQRSG